MPHRTFILPASISILSLPPVTICLSRNLIYVGAACFILSTIASDQSQMTAFEELPFDVFFEISKNLDLDDIVHLSQTCRQVKEVLLNDTVSHQVVEVSNAFTYTCKSLRLIPGTSCIYGRSPTSTARIVGLQRDFACDI